jgi:hypothetical protein
MAPGVGDLALVRLPPDPAGVANRRSYLHGTDYVLKPVAAIAGDTVCRFGLVITARGAVVALAKQRDGAGRPMLLWNGCHVLKPDDLFLLSTPPDSLLARQVEKMPLLVLRGPAAAHDRTVRDVIGPMTKLLGHSATPVTAATAPNLDPLLTRPILAQPDPPLRHQRSGDAVARAILALAESAAHPKGHMACPDSPDIWVVSALHTHW